MLRTRNFTPGQTPSDATIIANKAVALLVERESDVVEAVRHMPVNTALLNKLLTQAGRDRIRSRTCEKMRAELRRQLAENPSYLAPLKWIVEQAEQERLRRMTDKVAGLAQEEAKAVLAEPRIATSQTQLGAASSVTAFLATATVLVTADILDEPLIVIILGAIGLAAWLPTIVQFVRAFMISRANHRFFTSDKPVTEAAADIGRDAEKRTKIIRRRTGIALLSAGIAVSSSIGATVAAAQTSEYLPYMLVLNDAGKAALEATCGTQTVRRYSITVSVKESFSTDPVVFKVDGCADGQEISLRQALINLSIRLDQ